MMGFLMNLQGRLALIGLAASLAIIAGLWFRLDYVANQRAEERAAKEIALAANVANAETIQALQDGISRDAALLRELRDIRAEVTRATQQQRAELDELARSVDGVQEALTRPYPLELICLRDAQNGVANPACGDGAERGASTSVPTSSEPD